MVVSLGFLASVSFEEITAGMSGFVAGAILIGSGLVSLALLMRQAAPRVEDTGNRDSLPSDQAPVPRNAGEATRA